MQLQELTTVLTIHFAFLWLVKSVLLLRLLRRINYLRVLIGYIGICIAGVLLITLFTIRFTSIYGLSFDSWLVMLGAVAYSSLLGFYIRHLVLDLSQGATTYRGGAYFYMQGGAKTSPSYYVDLLPPNNGRKDRVEITAEDFLNMQKLKGDHYAVNNFTEGAIRITYLRNSGLALTPPMIEHEREINNRIEET